MAIGSEKEETNDTTARHVLICTQWCREKETKEILIHMNTNSANAENRGKLGKTQSLFEAHT